MTLQRTFVHAVVAAALVAAALPARPQAAAPVAADTVVLRVGATALTRADYERLVLGFDRAAGAPTTGPTPQSEQSAREVARLLAMTEEAQRRKLDQDPKIQALLRVRSYTILANALLADLVVEARADEAGTRALWASQDSGYYDLKVRQILVRHRGAKVEAGATGSQRSPEQAQALIAALHRKIADGASFQAVARASSDDATTRAGGGELPPFTRGAMVAEFERAAFDTPVGGLSAPFKTQYGWHLVQVVERVPFAFERVRSTLEFSRAQARLEQIASSAVQLEMAYFKP